MAKDFVDLLVWKKTLELWDAVNTLLDRPAFGRDYDLRQQIRDAIDSIVANIPEGFEQPTDRSFAQYLFRSKASAAEVRGRLLIAWRRRHIEPQDYARCSALALELSRMLGGFIKYLRNCDRKDRGLGNRTDPNAHSSSNIGEDSDFDRDSDPDPDPDSDSHPDSDSDSDPDSRL